MKLEKFNYSNGKRSRWFLYGVICTVALMVLINFFFSEAKYLKTESVKIAEGTINYKPYDFKIMAMYVENDTGNYEEADTMPTSGYVINEEKSYCTIDNVNKDSNVVLKTTDGNHTFNNLSKNEKCYIYFDRKGITIQDLIASKTIGTRTDFRNKIDNDNTGILFTAEDDDGISYYYAGAIQDNYVKFGKWSNDTEDVYIGYASDWSKNSRFLEYNSISECEAASEYNTNCELLSKAGKDMYWRIVRINGDGTLRMIYAGINPNSEKAEATIGVAKYNINHDDNAYVGYMYGTIGSSSYSETHKNTNDSNMKKYLDNFYKNNLINYSNYIDTNAGFCNDRTPSSQDTIVDYKNGYGTVYTFYRLETIMRSNVYDSSSNKAPTYKCTQENDLFTISSSNKGNKALTYPIALLTGDEALFAGIRYLTDDCNQNNYLTKSKVGFKTMTPSIWGEPYFDTFHVNYVEYGGGGYFSAGWLSDSVPVRPVINLRADVILTGDGTASNPYVVS